MPSASNGTGRLPETADVAIVGGGIIGLSCAHFLREHGRSPVVVEQGEVGLGSSYGNAGLVAPSHSIPLPAPGVVRQALRWLLHPASPFFVKARVDPALARWLMRFAWSARREPMLRGIPTLRDLNRLSAELYADLARDADAKLSYHHTGVLNVYGTSEAFAHGRREAELLERYGVPSEVLSGEQLVAAEPELRAGLAGGVLWPKDGYVDPAAFVTALHAHLELRGVQVLARTEVLGISEREGKVVVTTTAGALACDQVVVAAGAWTARLLRTLGARIHVEPAKGYSITIERSGARLRRPLLLTEAKVAVTPLGDALRLAGTLELAGLDVSINARRLEAVRRSAEPYLRNDTAGGREIAWRGLRPLSADGLPMIGRLSADSRVTVATGHGHIGVSLAPATGKLIAELLTGQRPTIDLEPLRPVR